MNDLESKVICINQWIRPEYHFERQGVGNCKICQPDYKNKECLGYYPVKIYSLNVQEETK